MRSFFFELVSAVFIIPAGQRYSPKGSKIATSTDTEVIVVVVVVVGSRIDFSRSKGKFHAEERGGGRETRIQVGVNY